MKVLGKATLFVMASYFQPYLAVKSDNGIGLENLRVSASSATPIARRVLTSPFQLAVQLSETAPAVCL